MENVTLGNKNLCGCVHHKTIPILVVLFGLAFLLLRLNILTEEFVGLAWPVIVIVVGLTKLYEHKCKCC